MTHDTGCRARQDVQSQHKRIPTCAGLLLLERRATAPPASAHPAMYEESQVDDPTSLMLCPAAPLPALSQQISLCSYNSADNCNKSLPNACAVITLGQCFLSSDVSIYYKVVQTGAEYTMTVSPTSTCDVSFASYTGALSTCISASSVSCVQLLTSRYLP